MRVYKVFGHYIDLDHVMMIGPCKLPNRSNPESVYSADIAHSRDSAPHGIVVCAIQFAFRDNPVHLPGPLYSNGQYEKEHGPLASPEAREHYTKLYWESVEELRVGYAELLAAWQEGQKDT